MSIQLLDPFMLYANNSPLRDWMGFEMEKGRGIVISQTMRIQLLWWDGRIDMLYNKYMGSSKKFKCLTQLISMHRCLFGWCYIPIWKYASLNLNRLWCQCHLICANLVISFDQEDLTYINVTCYKRRRVQSNILQKTSECSEIGTICIIWYS